MPHPRPATRARAVFARAAVLALGLVTAACGAVPGPTPPASGPAASSPAAEDTPRPGDVPFTAGAWPEAGSACGTPGYTGVLGRIEAVSARVVRFTLCAPDAAFTARLADPALGVLDTATVQRLATDPSAANALAGTGPYRIDRWTPGQDVRLVRVAATGSADARVPTIVLRWDADPTQRTMELQSATVDGIDAPGASDLQRIATLPELSVITRPGLATTYLAFGTGTAFSSVRVRRAIAAALDRASLASGAYAAGAVPAAQLAPCEVADACVGAKWYAFNGPAAAAALATAGFDLAETYPLHVPDRAVPGLPDPQGVADAVQAQLASSVGMKVVVDRVPVDAYTSRLASGSLDGLYLGGGASRLADPSGLLRPLLGPGVTSTPASRATGVAAALVAAASTADPAARTTAFTAANDALRRSAALIPLVHPGSVAAFRTDVTGAALSPLGADPLGTYVAGDRRQLVFMQAGEPHGAWCANQASVDAIRLCGLVVEGLYGFAPGTLTVEPRLAEGCDANEDATVWTCRLRPSVRFSDGAHLDAGDVLSTFRAQWDVAAPLRASGAPFVAWDALFGGPLAGPGESPSPGASPSPGSSATPDASVVPDG